jgi:hypothetical protein
MLPNVKYLTFAIMYVIVCLVSTTSNYPLAHLHVALPRSDATSIAAWFYVASEGKRTAKCCYGSLVHIRTTCFPVFVSFSCKDRYACNCVMYMCFLP